MVELSSHKYVYCLYSAAKSVHKEKLPIIYSNNGYTYVKASGEELVIIHTEAIREKFTDVTDLVGKNQTRQHGFRKYFYDTEEFNGKVLATQIFEAVSANDLISLLRDVTRNFEALTMSLETYKLALDKATEETRDDHFVTARQSDLFVEEIEQHVREIL